MKTSKLHTLLTVAAVAFNLFLLSAAADAQNRASPEECQTAQQNAQQACYMTARNATAALMLCTAAKMAYASLHCDSNDSVGSNDQDTPEDAQSDPQR